MPWIIIIILVVAAAALSFGLSEWVARRITSVQRKHDGERGAIRR